MNFINKIFSVIKNSVYDLTGKMSHTKISSYFILAVILLGNLAYIAIDICNGIMMWGKGMIFEIPMDHIIIYSITLTHHLVLLGLKKGSDTNYLNSKVGIEKAKLGMNDAPVTNVEQQNIDTIQQVNVTKPTETTETTDETLTEVIPETTDNSKTE